MYMSEKKDKICPIMSFRVFTEYEEFGDGYIFCFRDECAWWDSEHNKCGFISSLNPLTSKMKAIE